MKNTLLQPLRWTTVKPLFIAAVFLAASKLAQAQGTTTWAGAGADQFWATPANWTTSGGSIPPGLTDSVIFPNGTFPASPDGYDNIVGVNTTIGALSYLNTSGTRTTHLNDGVTLTVNGPFSEGVASSTTVVTMSGNGNFTVNNVSGTASIGGSGGSTETVTLNLADGTNTFNVKTLSLGESASNNGRNCNLNLGNGPTIFNADAIQFGTGKASGFVQWPAASTNGGLMIRDHTGSGRATMLLGNGTSGSGGSKGTINGTGHPVDILASTITLGRLGNTSGTQTGTLIVDHGTVDATSILMGVIPSSGSVGTGAANNNTLTIGGDPTNTAVLTVNSAGGGSFMVSDSSHAVRVSSATFNLLTNGTANIFCPIAKAQAINNTATLNISGTLNMEAATNTIGTRTIPIDNVTLDFATLNLAQDGSSVSIASVNLTINDTNTVNFSSLPPIIALPMTIPIISYTTLNSSLNLGVGTLPGDYHGHLVDDGLGTISLVVDSGTVVAAKHDIWVGGVNNNWDVSTLNWTNSGLTITNYTEADFVTFDDTAATGNVTLLGSQHSPSGVTVNNNSTNYVLSGAGRISGGTSLVKSGTASFTLAETGGDNFAGGIFVHGGTLILDDANSSIPGGLTNDPGTTVQIGNNDGAGTLPSGIVQINGSLVFNQSSNRTVSTTISGSGSVIQNGSNTLTLNGANTYTGNTVVSKGTLALAGGITLASPVVAVQNATLNLTTANSATLNAVTLTNGILNIGAGTNTPAFTALSLSNSTINIIANHDNVGGQAVLVGGALTTGGSTNMLIISSIQNLPLSPTLPFNIPLISYSSATFSGGFNFGWTNLPGITGYITNNSANNSIDLVVISAPQNLIWNGGSATGNNWSDAANWTGVPIVALDALTFDGLLRTNNVNDTPAGTTYVGLTFNNSAGDAPFTISGAPINLTGTALNNSADVQTIKLGLNVTGGVTLNGGTSGGSLAVLGGITNFSTGNQTVTLLGNGIVSDLWATNSTTNGGGQLTLQLGDAGGDWTIVDGTGNGSLVQAGNLQLSLNAGAGGGSIEFGSTNSAPNVDAGYPSNGVVNITGSAGTFNMNNGTLKANAVTIGNAGTVNAFFNMNGGTIILGPGSFTAAGGNGATVFTGSITNGSIYSTNGGSVILAQRALGTLSISGGLLDCNTLNLSSGTAASGVGVFNLNGGRLICTNVSVGSSAANGSGTLNFNGGVLQPGTNTLALFKQNNLVPLTNNVQAGGAIFDTAGFNATVNWPLQTDPALGGGPDGGLVKLGAGTLTLSSPNTYNGNTLVGGGTLIINSLQGPGLVIVSNGATLGGNGVISNNVTVNAGGALAPGNNAIGTLTVVGDVSLAGTTTMELNKTLGTNDLLLATNATPTTITYSGTLNVSTVAGTLAVNDSFKLFSASNYVGSFSAISPATPGTGLAWNTNNLIVDGTLKVVAGTSTGPTTNATITSVTLSGANLLIHGTNNNIPNTDGKFVVLTSTNMSTPLSNWTPVSTNNYNGTGTFDASVPVVPGVPQLFIDVKAVGN